MSKTKAKKIKKKTNSIKQDLITFDSTRTPAKNLDQVEDFLAEKRDRYSFAVVLRNETLTAEEIKDGEDGGKEQVKGKVIGLMGANSYPEIGYTFNPEYSGQGYATEALQAFIPKLFERMSSDSADSSAAGQAWDYAIARVDVENVSSMRLLERCGWTRGEITKNEYANPVLGLRDAVAYRIARPGMVLEDVLEAIRQKEEGSPFVPDLQ